MQQVAYYDTRWQERPVITKLALLRAGTILGELSNLPVTRPTMLDLGCGTGWFTAMVQDIGPAMGVDQAVTVARDRYPALTFLQADLECWTPNISPVDVVISQEVIEHLENQQHYIDAAAAALKPGGYLLLTTPNARVTYGLANEEWRRKHLTQPIERHLTPGQLKSLIAMRFDVIRLFSIHAGVGNRHIFRVLHSHVAKPLRPWLLRQLFGLHLVVVARKRG